MGVTRILFFEQHQTHTAPILNNRPATTFQDNSIQQTF